MYIYRKIWVKFVKPLCIFYWKFSEIFEHRHVKEHEIWGRTWFEKKNQKFRSVLYGHLQLKNKSKKLDFSENWSKSREIGRLPGGRSGGLGGGSGRQKSQIFGKFVFAIGVVWSWLGVDLVEFGRFSSDSGCFCVVFLRNFLKKLP